MTDDVNVTVEPITAQVANQENVQVSNYSTIIKTLVNNGAKRINALKIKNVNVSEETNYVRVSLTLTAPIPAYIRNEETGKFELGYSNVLFTSLYAISGALKEDEELGWMGNALLSNPNALNLILNGGTVDIIQQNVAENSEYINPFSFSDSAKTTIYDHDTIINHCIRFKLGKTGKEMSMMMAKSMMGF